jgi:hypothetical protein
VAIQDQLRRAIADSELNLHRISKGAGIVYPVLYRFVNGERDLTLETADKLCEFFGMRLTRPRRPKKGG